MAKRNKKQVPSNHVINSLLFKELRDENCQYIIFREFSKIHCFFSSVITNYEKHYINDITSDNSICFTRIFA